jgi:hypothetical protein
VKQQSLEALGAIPLPAPGDRLGDLAHGMLDQVLGDFRRPAYRAGFATSLLASVFLARLGVRALVGIPVAVMIGVSVERLYEMAEEIHESVTDAPGKI